MQQRKAEQLVFFFSALIGQDYLALMDGNAAYTYQRLCSLAATFV
jgi:hypothetical protein